MKNSTITGMMSFVFFLFIQNQSAFAQSASSVEVVQSFPIETTLQVPGIAQTQQVWLDIVNSATTTLDIEQYYINNVAGESLDPIITAIKTAAARGVQVRIILDSAFYGENSSEATDLTNVPNIDLRQVDFSPGIMHSKYMVADAKNAYTGSANMDWLALSHIHEMGLHTIDTTIAASLESIFDRDWPKATELPQAKKPSLFSTLRAFLTRRKPKAGLPGFQVVASPKQANPSGISDTLSSITALMNNAKHSLKIQVYQYTTAPYSKQGPAWTALDTVVRAAANRGVQVELMVDATVMSAKSKLDLQALAKLKNVQVKAVTIPQWSGGPLQYARLIHSKYFVIDGTSAWLGSENWIDSYFLNTRNVGITVQDVTTAGQVEQVFDNVWNSAYGVAIQ